MKDKRKKTLAWFFALCDSMGASYEAGTKIGYVVVKAANGRSMTLSAYDLETLSRRALTKRFERLAEGDPTLAPYPFEPAVRA